ncbi:MAG: hypothetical protein IPH44_28400 [Myxococcales bacterium]|nr:hypothetical protein [Myxococcales bacterium]MBK7191471.1 hypothetical protein [Myxococcales bacterium]
MPSPRLASTYLALALATLATAGCGREDPTAGIDAYVPRIDAGIDGPELAICDTVTQQCPTGEKCAIVRTGTTPPIGPRCVALTGAVAEGGACTQADDRDDCGVGLTCSQGLCRTLCHGPADCENGGECLQYATLRDGTCELPCAPLTAGSCPADQTCDARLGVGGSPVSTFCRAVGTQPTGAECFQGCALDYSCNNNFACAPMCNASHPCATGTCMTVPALPAFGVCM